MTSLSQTAYVHIREKLLRGDLDPGYELSETKLVNELGISRTPIREAIRRLECEGLLDQVAKRGTFVRRPSRREIEEIFQIRLLLEPFAAQQAALLRQPEALGPLEELFQMMQSLAEQFLATEDEVRRHALVCEHGVLDMQFHELLLKASGNERIAKIVSDAQIFRLAMGFPAKVAQDALQALPQTNKEHGDILRFVLLGEAQAAHDAMTAHVTMGRDNTLRYFDWLASQASSAAARQAENSPHE